MTGVIDRGRRDAVKARADIAAIVRRRVPKLRRCGREEEALCPFHEERTPSFRVVADKQFYHCFGCGAHGDVFDFVMRFDQVDFPAALERVEAESGGSVAIGAPAAGPARQAAAPRRDSSFIVSEEAGQAVWNAAGPAEGTLVETYLRHRGCDPALSGVLGVLRFHPRCPVGLWRRWEGPQDAFDHRPAMLAPICRVEGHPGARVLVQQGVHITYLAPDGRGKARFAPGRNGRRVPSRKIWGELAGGGVPVPPVGWTKWFDPTWIDLVGSGRPLVVGEGFETTLSLMALQRSAAGGFAALSLNNLQGFPVERRIGQDWAWPLWNLQPDTARSCFTIADVPSVVVGVDADMKPLRGRVVQERCNGPVVRRDLGGFARAQICAALASGQWRAAGSARVEVVRPPMGHDFNDAEAA